MKLARRYNTLACFTALLAALAYCAADDNTLLLAILSLLACAGAWRSSRGERPWALPRWLVNLLMLAAIIDAILKVMSRGATIGYWTGAASTPIVSTLSQFLVYILLVKLFDRRNPRDEAHVLSLSIFVVVGAVLTSNQLLVGLLVLAFAPCVICAAMLLQLVGGARTAHETARAAGLGAEAVPEHVPPSPRRFRRDFAGAAGVAIMGTLAIATVSFVLMPRGLWRDVLGGFGKVDGGATVGFTDQIRLGANSGLLQNSDNQNPILNIRLTDSTGNKLGELRGTLYLRGAVKTTYSHSTRAWTAEERVIPRNAAEGSSQRDDLSEIRGSRATISGNFVYETSENLPLRLADPERAQIVIRQEITLRRPVRPPGYLFTMWRPISFTSAQPLVVEPPARDMVLRAGMGAGALKSYTVLSALEYSDDREPAREDVSFDSEFIRTLATGLLTSRDIPTDPAQRDAAANRRAAQAFTDHLRTTYEYSRDMTASEPGEDPIEMFLTRTKRGHCEYFASAMVAMCQSVGLDARLIAGYLATEFSRATGEYTVRESNAHAWAEVRMAPGRWQTFDPSPPDAIEAIHRPPVGVVARLRQWYEAINFTWGSAVISFDNRTQQKLVGSPDGWRGLMSRFGEIVTGLREQFGGLAGIIRLVVFSIAAASVLWAVRRGLRVRRRARARAGLPAAVAHTDPVLAKLLVQAGFYADALGLLERSGLAKPSHVPPLMHAGALPPAAGPIAGAFSRLAQLFYAVRFGRRALTPEEQRTAAASLAELDGLLRERAVRSIEAARAGAVER